MFRKNFLFYITFFSYFWLLFSKTLIETQYSKDIRRCTKVEKKKSNVESIFDFFDSFERFSFNVYELKNPEYRNLNPYQRMKLMEERRKEFDKNHPVKEKYEEKCELYDKVIKFYDDGTIEEIPYNIRPLY